MAKKTRSLYIKTITDMHAIPADKVDLFCEDLRLWLRLMRMAEDEGMKTTSARDVFQWIDDGRHNVKINITMYQPKDKK